MESQVITWLLNALQSASPIAAGICFLAMLKAWRDLADERDERIALQKQNTELLERVIRGLSDSTAAITAHTETIRATKGAFYSLKDTLSQIPALRGRIKHGQ
jgi:hypothetical protein